MSRCVWSLGLAALWFVSIAPFAYGQKPEAKTMRGDRMLADYFRQETQKLSDDCLTGIETLEEWTAQRETYRQQLFDMLGLNPLPQRSNLKATTTGTVEHEEFTVEKVHFQSLPGLYVTGNLYVPKNLDKPAPAILYVCGHGRVKKGDVSFGNKAHYQHHGGWFARNGYVCLTIDTLQLGEIEGLHHGTHNLDMWWWINRGYTPAGVEAWNGIRALDYLQSRKEVDSERLGVTGRSGGGAYSWWVAALDDRIKAAVPVAGITDLENHVVDGCVAGHCDCMFMVNTFRWDYPLVAALVAPRPLLISNTDRDRIFPLEGVFRTHQKVRKIYQLYEAPEKLALQITAGGHSDTQELHIHAFRWLDQHLRGVDQPVEDVAVKFFEPEQLRVFDQLPSDEVNTKIQESFVPQAAEPTVPQSPSDWTAQRDAWRAKLDQYVFAGWPSEAGPLEVKQAFAAERDGLEMRAYDFTSQQGIRLRLYMVQRADRPQPQKIVMLNVLDEPNWQKFLATMRPAFENELREEGLPERDEASYQETRKQLETQPRTLVFVAPRGVGPTRWNQELPAVRHLLRRFYLLGQTADGMQVWDVRRAIQAVRTLPELNGAELRLQGEGGMAANALYASLYEPDVARLDLTALPVTHRQGPHYLNIARFLDLPQAVAMAAERSQVVLGATDQKAWEYPVSVAEQLDWDAKQLQFLGISAE